MKTPQATRQGAHKLVIDVIDVIGRPRDDINDKNDVFVGTLRGREIDPDADPRNVLANEPPPVLPHGWTIDRYLDHLRAGGSPCPDDAIPPAPVYTGPPITDDELARVLSARPWHLMDPNRP